MTLQAYYARHAMRSASRRMYALLALSFLLGGVAGYLVGR